MESDASVQIPPQQQVQASCPSIDPSPEMVPQDTSTWNLPPAGSDGAEKERVRNLSKTFGHIPGVPIFSRWRMRKECSNAAVHRSIMAGICGNKNYGAYSVALSGGYEDDEDGGDVIIYTGTGGKKRYTDDSPPKRIRCPRQMVKDQSWTDGGNNALMISFRTGHPLRVIRGYKCPSKYAPAEGYRYDGLYIVASCWMAKGKEGYKICRCRLERLPDQPPLPLRPVTIPASRKKRKERLVRRPTYGTVTSSNIPNQTNADVGLDQCNPAQNAVREPETLLHLPQERAMSETTTYSWPDISMDGEEPPSLQHQVSTDPGLSGHKCNENTDINTTEEDGNDHRGEDDATLVPSEDGRADLPLNERVDNGMETEYLPDV